MQTDATAAVKTGLDALALKPAECDLSDATSLPFDRVTIDFEGRGHVPDRETLERLAAACEVRVTTPVRADGFDPLGDDSLLSRLPDDVGRVLVAGHPAYLDGAETARAIAPRLGAAIESSTDPWVGTEGIERLATAADATLFELLAPGVERELRALRAAGFDREIAVYAPTVLSADDDEVLDAVGPYVSRRAPVDERLPARCPSDADASGRARDVLLQAASEYAVVGDVGTVRERVAALKHAGADHVVGYPARGLEAFRR